MIDSEKRDFMAVMMTTADLYGRGIKPERVAVYWNALKHRELIDIKGAINAHIQDASRGRFFPLPADVSAQLPAERNLWLDADEAWAMCPKDESASAAMCNEMSQALVVASDLIGDGDMVAARMAFKAAYNRLVGNAKADGKAPKWFPSLGLDKDGRHFAQVKAVEMTNLGLPSADRLALPRPDSEQLVSFDYLCEEAAGRDADPDVARVAISELKKKMGIKS